MKKILLFPLMLLLALTVTACDKDSPQPNDDTHQEGNSGNDNQQGGEDDNNNPTPGGNAKYLVLFSSRSGNTETMAKQISQTLGCDRMEVVPATAYEEDYNTMLQRAQREQAAIAQGSYPAINTTVENLSEYDMIFVGYPIWYGHMATPMQAFLHNHADQLKGKRIALFASSGSSGINTSVAEARTLIPDATFTETLLLTSGTINQVSTRIPAWLEQIGAEPISNNNNDNPTNNPRMIHIITDGRTLTATMEDNSAARDFLSRLPLEVTLNDYASAEKIFYPSPALDISDAPRGFSNPQPGDITIYAPWGNVAIFYKSFSSSNSLIRIGHIDGTGIETLNTAGDIRVRFERQNP